MMCCFFVLQYRTLECNRRWLLDVALDDPIYCGDKLKYCINKFEILQQNNILMLQTIQCWNMCCCDAVIAIHGCHGWCIDLFLESFAQNMLWWGLRVELNHFSYVCNCNFYCWDCIVRCCCDKYYFSLFLVSPTCGGSLRQEWHEVVHQQVQTMLLFFCCNIYLVGLQRGRKSYDDWVEWFS